MNKYYIYFLREKIYCGLCDDNVKYFMKTRIKIFLYCHSVKYMVNMPLSLLSTLPRKETTIQTENNLVVRHETNVGPCPAFPNTV